MTLYYVHDPMCSWCWAFRPAWVKLRAILRAQAPDLRVVSLLGGLAPDSDMPMSPSLRAEIQQHWRTIQQVVPDTPFNFDFWTRCIPRRSTFPACRAVIAAGMQADATGNALEVEDRMILAIQQAYYLQARNPSDEALLVQLAGETGLDGKRFAIDLNTAAVHNRLAREIELARRIGARGFPSLIMEHHAHYHPVAIDYSDAEGMRMQILSIADGKSG
jgi:putative protein-disulfide isomerase